MRRFLTITVIFTLLVIVVFISIELWLNNNFENDIHYNDYVNAYNRVHSMQFNAQKLLTEMAATNELTFDPTNASKLTEVLANLKLPKAGSKPVLILGSSQLIVVNDDWTYDRHKKTAGEIIERKIPDLEVYNLSMAIMNYNEKEILLRKLIEIVDFEKVLVFITPLDLYNDDIRPEITELTTLTMEEIKAKKYSKRALAGLGGDSVDISATPNPLGNFPVNRDLLKMWLKDKIAQYSLEDTTINRDADDWELVVSVADSLAKGEWTNSQAFSGEHSLYLKNSGYAQFEWSTKNAITLDEPTKEITFGIAYKTKAIENCQLCALDFQVIYEDNTVDYYYRDLHFKQGTNDWTLMSKPTSFGQNVIAIKPSVLFYSGSGELWVDDVVAVPSHSTNIVPNHDLEKQQENSIDTYHYSIKDWDRITDRGLKLVKNLAVEKLKNGFEAAVIMTPIYETDGRFPYYEVLYNSFVNNIKIECEQNGVKFFDATRILEPKHFSIYDSGPKQGLIDIHHFDSEGHEILAEFLIDNLFTE